MTTDMQAVVEQVSMGLFKTRDITLVTTLMCPEYEGVALDKVIPDNEWPPNGKPLCTFVLLVAAGAEESVIGWYTQHNSDSGLPVNNTRVYDRCKKELVDAMRQARGVVMSASSATGRRN